MGGIQRKGRARGLPLARVVACIVVAVSAGRACADADADGFVRRLVEEAARAIEAAAWSGPDAAASPVRGALDEVDAVRARAALVAGLPARPASAWRAMRAGARADAALARLDDEGLERVASLLVRELAIARLAVAEDAGIREGWPAALVAETLAAMPPPVANPMAARDMLRSLGRADRPRGSAGREELLRDARVRLCASIALRDRWLAVLRECGRLAG